MEGNGKRKRDGAADGGWLPLRTVARLTGLSPDLIRVWEKRYQVVSPRRGPRSARVYSEADVERLRLLAAAVGTGRAIGDVARLAEAELRRVVESSVRLTVRDGGAGAAPEPFSEARHDQWFRERFWEAVLKFDAVGLERVFGDALAIWGLDTWITLHLAPVLDEVGERWAAGELLVAHEHFVSAALRNFVGQLLRVRRVTGWPVVACATPPGERHELGLLLANLVLADRGIPVLYLGCEVPQENLLEAARAQRVRVVALSAVDDANRASSVAELDWLLRHLRSVDFWLGGRDASAVGAALGRKHRRLRLFRSLGDFLQYVDANRTLLSGVPLRGAESWA